LLAALSRAKALAFAAGSIYCHIFVVFMALHTAMSALSCLDAHHGNRTPHSIKHPLQLFSSDTSVKIPKPIQLLPNIGSAQAIGKSWHSLGKTKTCKVLHIGISRIEKNDTKTRLHPSSARRQGSMT
jgi:hypothetical protein